MSFIDKSNFKIWRHTNVIQVEKDVNYGTVHHSNGNKTNKIYISN